MTDSGETFPLDWNEWRTQWAAWKADHAEHLGRSSYRFGRKNFMADEVLGVWSINGRPVELSEVTFGANRYVGITFGSASGSDRPDAPLVSTFAELEHELGLDQ
jgi:hypothetical protein